MTDQSESHLENRSFNKELVWGAVFGVGGAVSSFVWGKLAGDILPTTSSYKIFIFTVLPGISVTLGFYLIALLKNQHALVKAARTELPLIIEGQLTNTFNREGKDLLKDTIIHGVIKDVVGASSGKPRYHETALSFLKTLHEVDEQLAPALEIIARDHVNALTEKLRKLQHDDLAYSVNGKEQVDISQSFADSAKSSIVFFDPKIYANIEQDWSDVFKHFVRTKLKNRGINKRQYILCENTSDIRNPTALITALQVFCTEMKNAGFEVYLISKRLIDESHNKNFVSRLEIYDDECVLKVQSQDSYDQTEPLSITLGTVGKDHNVAVARQLLLDHGQRVP